MRKITLTPETMFNSVVSITAIDRIHTLHLMNVE